MEFSLPKRGREEIQQAIRARIDYVRKHQDHTKPNAGSIFRSGYRDSTKIRSLQVERARMSEKTSNWVLNDFGPAADVLKLIQLVGQQHQLPPEREIVIW